MTSQRVRIRSVPMMPALVTGAWAGFVPGLFIGGAAGTLISFGAGAALEWMRELSFTTGIQQQLLPFGDRIGLLQTLQDDWLIVIPVTAVAVGILSALIGVLTAALVSASYGSLLGGVEVEIEPAGGASAAAAAPGPERARPGVKREHRRRGRRRSDSAA
jgi:hypothetical protein